MARSFSTLALVCLAALSASACGPPVDPPWLIDGATELVLEVEVIEQGPYGDRLVPGPRTPHAALPLDTLALRPVIVDAAGPIEAETLEGQWMLCPGLGGCIVREAVVDRPACDPTELLPSQPCTFATGGTATLTLADIPAQAPPQLDSLFDLLAGPTVAFVGVRSDAGPSLDDCLARIDARRDLEGCLLMERALGLGPVGELVPLLEAIGVDPGVGSEAQSLLAAGRNYNPAVERFTIHSAGDTQTVLAGSRVEVPVGGEILLRLVTTADDLDTYEAVIGDDSFEFSDDLFAQWWFDREIGWLDEPELAVRWSWDAVREPTRVYVALRDDRRAEAWGWLELVPIR